jgi:O-antigen/teichoic acid export membrane protein
MERGDVPWKGPSVTTRRPNHSLDRMMARAVAWNAASRWASQILSWVSTIVVARLLTPADYGIVGMAGLYLNLALLVSTAGIGDTIIALRDLTRRQIAELNTVSIILGLGLVALSCGLALPLSRFFSTPALFGVILISSLMYLINAFQIVPKALLQRDLQFKLLAFIDMIRAFSQIVITIFFVFLKFGYWSLVAGYMMSTLTSSVLTVLWRNHGFAIPDLKLLRRELKFSRSVMLSNIAWYAYDNSDFGVAGRVLGKAPLGNYTVAWTISSAPVEKIANLVANVTPSFFSALQSDKTELRRYLLRITEILSLVCMPASIGIVLTADYLVPVLLGQKWFGVIGPLRILGGFVAARSIATILPNLLIAIGDASFVMWASVGAAIVMPISFLIGARWGTNGIASAWVIAYPIVTIPIYYRVMRKTGLSWKEYGSAISPAICGSVIMVGVVLIFRYLLRSHSHSVVELISLIVAGCAAYGGGLFVLYRTRVISIIKTAGDIFRKARFVDNISQDESKGSGLVPR